MTSSFGRRFVAIAFAAALIVLGVLSGAWVRTLASELQKQGVSNDLAVVVANVSGALRQVDVPPGARSVDHAEMAPFVGGWAKHGHQLVIAPDGSAEASWRTYRWCKDPGVRPPCDSFRGDEIVSGGYARMVFTRAQAGTAYGTMMETNAPGSPPAPYPVLLTIQPNGTAVLLSGDALVLAPEQRRPTDGTVFCRPEAWQTEWCGA